jgi:alpha-ketoglutarate-dependent taurine dioxygenase
MLTEIVTDRRAWTGAELAPEAWTLRIPRACLDELEQALATIRAETLPLYLRRTEDFELAACRALMGEVKRRLFDGIGFAVLDRLPVESMSQDEATALYWLLSSLLARPVAQKLDGTMVYLVRDTGATLKPGSGIRPTVTNVELVYHNDNSYNETPPECVGLMCLSQAREGGVSRVLNFYAAHNLLLREHGNLLPRLYQPFWYDRHREFFPGEPETHSAPIFDYDGKRLTARLALLEIWGGYELRGERLDPDGEAALEAMQAVMHRPGLAAELQIRPGQIQYVNNRSTGHMRTAFVDGDRPEEKRLLVRLWLRDAGRRGYRG